MRILVIDASAVALDWVLRCQAAGHSVRWYVPNKPRTTNIGAGLAPQVQAWQPHMDWADLVMMTDNLAYTAEIDKWRRPGGPSIVGPTAKFADWEMDRDIGMSMFRKRGLAVADSQEFNNFDAAIRYVEKQGKAYVSKPSGDADKALSYVAKSAEDLIYMLMRWKKQGRNKAPFILQEKIRGCEMAVGGWFGPHGFNRGWCENWEFKKLLPGDLGPNTGEQGTVLRYVEKSLLADRVLKPFERDLEESGYVGYIDVNCIIDDEGTPWPLEFTMRPGWPTFNIQQRLYDGDPAGWLMCLANGEDLKAATLNEVAVGVVLSMPDYPFNKIPASEVSGIPIYGLKPSTMTSIHLCDVMLGEAPLLMDGRAGMVPCYATAGTYVLVASGTGDTVSRARKKAYATLSTICLPNSPMYRTDIGLRLQNELRQVQEHGYATGLSYRGSPQQN